MRAVAKDIRLLLQAQIFVKDNHPQISIDTCNTHLMNLDVDVAGGLIPWIVNLFRSDVSQIIKEAINKQVH